MKNTLIVLFALLIAVTCYRGAVCAEPDEPAAAAEAVVSAEDPAVSGEEVSEEVTEEATEDPDSGSHTVDDITSMEDPTRIAQDLVGSDTISSYKLLPFRAGNEAFQELTEIWRKAKKALAENDVDRADALMTELQGRCLDFGIDSFEDLSASILKEGMLQLDTGNNANAVKLFDLAARVSPNYPPAYFAKGWGIFKQNKLKFLLSIDSFIEGAIRATHNFWWSFNFLGNKATSLLFTVAALFSLFGLFMAIRYMPLLAHDLAEKFGMIGREPFFKHFLVPAVFFAVLFVLGYWWTVALLLIFLWAYFNKREKILSVLFFVLVIFMPTIMSNYAGFLYANSNRTLWVMDEVNKGFIETGTEAFIKEKLAAEPDNNLLKMSLAQVYKKQRRLDEAIAIYESLIKATPESQIYRNNLGNAYLLSGRLDDAIEQYKAAVQYGSDSALPYFNLSQAYGEKLMFTEREQAKNKAALFAPNLIEQITKRSGNNPYRFTFDEEIPSSEFWNIALTPTDESEVLAESTWSTMVKVMPLDRMPVAGVVMIIFLFVSNTIRKRGLISHYCDKCGVVSCRKCQRPHFSKDLCVQCYLAFVKMEGVEARDRVRKTIEIRERHGRAGMICRISSLLLPGAGHFILGKPLRGFVLTGLFIFFLKDIFFGSFIKSPYGISLDILSPEVVFMFVLLVLVYLISQLDIFRLTLKSKG